jgi:hypothetical protein
MQPGDAVRFRFGCTETELFGTLANLTTDQQGKPAALIRVAGFPNWLHREPLENIEPVPVYPSLLHRLAGQSACNGNCLQGRTCVCSRAGVSS